MSTPKENKLIEILESSDEFEVLEISSDEEEPEVKVVPLFPIKNSNGANNRNNNNSDRSSSKSTKEERRCNSSNSKNYSLIQVSLNRPTDPTQVSGRSQSMSFESVSEAIEEVNRIWGVVFEVSNDDLRVFVKSVNESSCAFGILKEGDEVVGLFGDKFLSAGMFVKVLIHTSTASIEVKREESLFERHQRLKLEKLENFAAHQEKHQNKSNRSTPVSSSSEEEEDENDGGLNGHIHRQQLPAAEAHLSKTFPSTETVILAPKKPSFSVSQRRCSSLNRNYSQKLQKTGLISTQSHGKKNKNQGTKAVTEFELPSCWRLEEGKRGKKTFIHVRSGAKVADPALMPEILQILSNPLKSRSALSIIRNVKKKHREAEKQNKRIDGSLSSSSFIDSPDLVQTSFPNHHHHQQQQPLRPKRKLSHTAAEGCSSEVEMSSNANAGRNQDRESEGKNNPIQLNQHTESLTTVEKDMPVPKSDEQLPESNLEYNKPKMRRMRHYEQHELPDGWKVLISQSNKKIYEHIQSGVRIQQSVSVVTRIFEYMEQGMRIMDARDKAFKEYREGKIRS